MEVRFAKKEDIEQLIKCCKAHAEYEKADYDDRNKAQLLFDYLFNSKDVLNCLVVVKQSQILGYATFMKQFSTWSAEYYLYIDCLFLNETIRGKGVGKKLMKEIKRIATLKKCTWIEWQTPNFNHKAIQFYRHLGATSKSKERFLWDLKKPIENQDRHKN